MSGLHRDHRGHGAEVLGKCRCRLGTLAFKILTRSKTFVVTDGVNLIPFSFGKRKLGSVLANEIDFESALHLSFQKLHNKEELQWD